VLREFFGRLVERHVAAVSEVDRVETEPMSSVAKPDGGRAVSPGDREE